MKPGTARAFALRRRAHTRAPGPESLSLGSFGDSAHLSRVMSLVRHLSAGFRRLSAVSRRLSAVSRRSSAVSRRLSAGFRRSSAGSRRLPAIVVRKLPASLGVLPGTLFESLSSIQ